ncbi:hypothetical protein CAPTEDRAFT_179695 [Capitella teleta]|uniref:RING-type domain-containing protein n=1 Tax=Capitella teleta TaxID=283909 RepID=R7U7H3_CAPTE|nr:hypothetical protein CAPTEDRAFT_179695 [Capitella teleta]|eukprot:ELU02315.1 hypothetical protein CAPTEDRAFT_179695 [Capitella teleta]
MMTITLAQLKASLPLLGVGFMTLFLSLCFCCYMWRLKKQGQKEMGYKEVCYKNRRKSQAETCPVCLDDFSPKDKLAVCECTHIFHTKCLILWLNQSPTCPLCKSNLGSGPGESTHLVLTPGQVDLGSSV